MSLLCISWTGLYSRVSTLWTISRIYTGSNRWPTIRKRLKRIEEGSLKTGEANLWPSTGTKPTKRNSVNYCLKVGTCVADTSAASTRQSIKLSSAVKTHVLFIVVRTAQVKQWGNSPRRKYRRCYKRRSSSWISQMRPAHSSLRLERMARWDFALKIVNWAQ